MNEELSSPFDNGDGMTLNKEELYRSIVEHTPDVITRWSAALKLTYANPAFEKKTGIPNASLYGKTCSEMGQPDDIALPWMDSLRTVFKTGKALERYHSFPTPDGPAHFYSRIVPEKNNKGEIETVLDIARDMTEQKNAEQEIKSQALYISQVAQVVPEIITVVELPSRKILYSNNENLALNGFNREELLQMSLDERKQLVHPDDGPALGEYWDSFLSLADGETTMFEYRMRSIAGEWLWLHARGQVFERNAEGKPAKVLNVLQDITERKKAEQQIKENAHFIRQVMDTTPDIIYIMDLSTRQMIYCNRQIAADLGYTKTQIAAMENPLFNIMHKEDIPVITDHLKKMKTVTQDDKVFEVEYRLINAKGAINWFCDRSAVFRRNGRKVPVEKIGITQNITKEKLREEQIITDLDIIAQAEEIAEMGSWEYDILTGSFKWSKGMYQLFNLPKNKKVIPDIYFDYTPEEEHVVVKKVVDNIRYEFTPFEEIITLIPEGQEEKIVKIKAVVIKDKKKRPVKIVGVDLNITHQIKAAREISSLNKILLARNRDLEELNGELKTFNTMVSRDYKETIQILYTNLEYIVSKEARNLSDTSKANIRRAQSAIQRMKLLTEDINAYLGLHDIAINKSLINPNQIVADVVLQLKGKIEQAGATIELTDLPSLYADPLLFSILVTNLLDNSLKFRKLAFPSIIKIKYSQADEMNAISGAISNMPYIIVSISDNGIGFREEEAENIFELFVRLQEGGKYKGSGIGLAICKKIMAMHNGFITAESVPATGSTFNCYFPSREPPL